MLVNYDHSEAAEEAIQKVCGQKESFIFADLLGIN